MNKKIKNVINNKIDYVFILLTILLQSLSAIFAKMASISTSGLNLFNVTIKHYYFLSILCLCFQAITWQLTLRKFPLFFAYIWMSLVYIIVLLSSFYIFDEIITIGNIIGIIFIIFGIIVINLPMRDND